VIAIVVARASNGVIGRDGSLPWHLPSDLKRFRELTMGHAVLMGRRTFESLPDAYRPLPGRRNLVLSSKLALPVDGAQGAELFGDVDTALAACGSECFVIGGETVYRATLGLARRAYVTEIERELQGDAFFPELQPSEWRCVEQSPRSSENGLTFSFRVFERLPEEHASGSV
jgi:dihydrofolate reductase